MDEWVKIEVTVSYGWVGAEESDTIEFRRSDWDAMTDQDRDAAMQEHINTMIANRVDAGWEVIEGED